MDPTPERQEKLERVVASRQQGVLVLEDIHDPHNAAAAFRSADAFGIQDVYLIFDQEKPFDPKKKGKSTSSSASKWLDFTIYHSTKECLSDLKSEGYETIATILDDSAESIFDADLPSPKTAILLGNEHRGLSETAISMADRKMMIPMPGMVQSLNISVSASVFLFELTRKRMSQGMESFLLSEERRADLIKDFVSR